MLTAHYAVSQRQKRAPSAKELHTKFAGKKLQLVEALYHCKPAMALPPAERKAIIN
jgi:hypothetical protein